MGSIYHPSCTSHAISNSVLNRNKSAKNIIVFEFQGDFVAMPCPLYAGCNLTLLFLLESVPKY